MIRPDAAKLVARDILSVYSPNSPEYVVELVASLIMSAVRSDEAKQDIELRAQEIERRTDRLNATRESEPS